MKFTLPFEEKRKDPRARINFPISMTDYTNGKEYTGHCLDLSNSGLRVILKDCLTLNTPLLISLNSPLGLEPFCARARVIHSEANPSEGPDSYQTGLEITEILDLSDLTAQKSSSRSMSSKSESKLSST